MGLNFRNSKAQWSYSGFNDFRSRVWTICGFPDNLRNIYYGRTSVSLDVAKDHALYDLFHHSDCDGELTAAQLNRMLPELKRVYGVMVEENRCMDHDVSALGELLITVEQCIHENKPLVFC